MPADPGLSTTDRLPVVTEFTAAVEACPGHVWRQEDRRDGPPANALEVEWYIVEVCQLCRAARCDTWAHPVFPDERCIEPRHHRAEHRFANGAHYPVGGFLVA